MHLDKGEQDRGCRVRNGPLFRRKGLAYLVLVFGLGMVLSACGGVTTTATATPAGGAAGSTTPAGGGAQSSTKPNPCTLLTAAELQAQLGVAFKDGELEPNTDLSGPGAAACHWTPDPATAYDIVTLSIENLDASVFDFGKQQSASQQITGVGDDAYMDSTGVLHIKKGSWEVSLVIGVGSQRRTTSAQMTSLGKLAISRV